MNKTYYCGRYRYNTGEYGIAIETDLDFLPPTMYEVDQVRAQNKKEALFNWITRLQLKAG